MQAWEQIRHVVVVGLGITGLSVVKHLTKYQPHLQVKVIDTRANPPSRELLPSSVELHCGGWNNTWLAHADLVVANPGIALATPEIQAVIDQGIPVVGDIELFAWAVDKPVVAITGSNGKSTVTDLTGVMAKSAGVDAAIGGNIGIPALDLLELDADLYILELSSFQLETTSSLVLQAAAFLNLSEDHMDRYQGMDDYRQAKLRIFEHAKTAIVNRDDRQTFPEHTQINTLTFGFDNKEFGLLEQEGECWLSRDGQPIIAASELNLVGRHNLSNALVALALLEQCGVDYAKALDGLKSYTGLTHRCQVVANNNGIVWVNDSKATNVASTLAALSGLNYAGTLYLLVGGVGKGADFSELAPILTELNVKLGCFGKDGREFLPLHPSSQYFADMGSALESYSEDLVAGDMVMLSPACASFDQFANFMARGDAFTQLAQHYSQSIQG
ncbi:UDP-N-acetylmuramoyl-L-alanine--D-glutamate ligase [Vibrio sp. 10N.286.49.B3]|uniref:UDP-N-acetylmuramoyl-L-alanine--D-glutamate ligase n=1 Tax=Vibrio sp. 10N.286.49.B3 TaxID=1880855 RepID=UPI000C83ED02|nr:UDP-N-acetylmuramoyl-L-alanine--D-glutamate ligase [Vibrio sp. 10N.286.49.B3]PMH39787.1 UDP-N-acetylmuramoyl-L-alanine--D-glutamate ligase [Vibrio sp. 10N.286.49.B3]